MQMLCKLKSWKLFEPAGSGRGADQVGDEDPFAVQLVSWTREGRVLCVAGATHVLAYCFRKQEMTSEVPVSAMARVRSVILFLRFVIRRRREGWIR